MNDEKTAVLRSALGEAVPRRQLCCEHKPWQTPGLKVFPAAAAEIGTFSNPDAGVTAS